MSYGTLNDMYADLGLDMQRKRITYSLPGEINESEVVAKGVQPGSSYAEQMDDDAVNAGGLLFDRSVFHGYGTVLIHSVDAA
jgi:hypothetical protein